MTRVAQLFSVLSMLSPVMVLSTVLLKWVHWFWWVRQRTTSEVSKPLAPLGGGIARWRGGLTRHSTSLRTQTPCSASFACRPEVLSGIRVENYFLISTLFFHIILNRVASWPVCGFDHANSSAANLSRLVEIKPVLNIVWCWPDHIYFILCR